MRAVEESAEAGVVKKPLETWAERRAEEPREGTQPTLRWGYGVQENETTRVLQLRQPPVEMEMRPEVDSSECRTPMFSESNLPREEAKDEA